MPFDLGAIPPTPRPVAMGSGCAQARGTTPLFFPLAGPGESWALGPFTLTRFDSAPATLHRAPDQARRDLRDDWLLCVGPGPVTRLRHDDNPVTAPAGTPFALSLAEAFTVGCDERGCLALLVPRENLPECSAALDRGGAAPLASAPGRLLGGLLLHLVGELPRMRDAERPRAVEAIRALLMAAVAAGAMPVRADDAAVQAVRLARVKAIIRQHLRSPDLSPEWLCGMTGMSRSQLYRLFEPTGGVRREIQRERLRQAHRAIADAGDRRSIHQIGEEIGFVEPTAFSRAFRREFGYAPSTLRRPPAPGWSAAPGMM